MLQILSKYPEYPSSQIYLLEMFHFPAKRIFLFPNHIHYICCKFYTHVIIDGRYNGV